MDGWSLTYKVIIGTPSETEKSFADWGLGPPTLATVNQGLDVMTVEQEGADFTSEETFATGNVAIVKFNGVRQFYGRIRKPKRHGTSEAEGMSWRFEGPWYWLKTTHFRQPWLCYADPNVGTSELVTKYTGRLFLGTKIVGDLLVYQDSAEQIAEIVNWCIAQGGHLALDAADLPAIQFPVREVKNRYCSECITMVLQLCPDATTWFDYSTEPYPTLRIKRKANQTIVNLSTTAGYQLEAGEISARDDLQTAGVVMEFEQTFTVNGKAQRSIAYDIYPPDITGLSPGVLVATVDLEGASINEAAAPVNIASVDTSLASFWQAVRPDLRNHNDETGQVIAIQNLTVRALPRTTAFGQRIALGAFAEWMPGLCVEEELRALVSYDVQVRDRFGQSFVTEKFVDRLVTFTAKMTNLPAGARTYRNTSVESPGEPVPIGMAKAIYDATSQLSYDGSVTITEDECSGLVKVGNVINLLDGLAEYATMGAMVQEVTQNFETGQSMVRFGTAAHLGPDDLIEYLRALRNRERVTAFSTRINGISNRGSSVALPSQYEKDLLAEGTYARTKQTWYDPATANGYKVIISIADLVAIAGATAAKTGEIKLREISVCDKDTGVERKMVVLGSVVYD